MPGVGGGVSCVPTADGLGLGVKKGAGGPCPQNRRLFSPSPGLGHGDPSYSFPCGVGWGRAGSCGLTALLPAGSQGATRKYKVWMRHRYHSCCNRLRELLAHSSFEVKVSGADCLEHSLHPQPQVVHTHGGKVTTAPFCVPGRVVVPRPRPSSLSGWCFGGWFCCAFGTCGSAMSRALGLHCEGASRGEPVAWHLSHFATRRPQELALSTLMRFVQLEGVHPLEKPKWDGCYLFPHQLFKVGAKWGWGAGKGPGAGG